jgi:neutral ceramidase
LFGDYETFIKITKIGNTLILGMPADFSGEIMVELDAYAKQKGVDLIITSFNGGYVGYITADKIYDSGSYETLTMSWYGYQTGGYFTEVSKDIVDKISLIN